MSYLQALTSLFTILLAAIILYLLGSYYTLSPLSSAPPPSPDLPPASPPSPLPDTSTSQSQFFESLTSSDQTLFFNYPQTWSLSSQASQTIISGEDVVESWSLTPPDSQDLKIEITIARNFPQTLENFDCEPASNICHKVTINQASYKKIDFSFANEELIVYATQKQSKTYLISILGQTSDDSLNRQKDSIINSIFIR